MSILMRSTGFPFRGVWRHLEDLLNERSLLGRLGLTEGGYPPANVYETPSDVILEFEAPGVPKENIELTITGGAVTLKVNRPIEGDIPPEKYFYRERWRGEFGRTVTVPGTVDAGGAKASYRDGVLTVTIPKKEEARPKRINVNVG